MPIHTPWSSRRTKPLRVALVTDTYAPAANGVVRSVQTSLEALRALGVDAHVFAPAARSHARACPLPNVSYFPAIETSIYPNLHLSVLPLLPRHLKGYDVVHVHTPGPLGLAALVAARRLGIPALYTYHTRFEDLLHYVAPFESAERMLTKAAARVHGSLTRQTAAVVAPTPAIADELRRLYGIEPEVVPTGVDLGAFRSSVANELMREREPRRDPVVLHLGRISREKNLETVLRAFVHVLEQAPEAKLRVAGAGPDHERSVRLARDLGLGDRVEFLGYVREDDLSAVYASADVYVTASEFETQGLTVLEAMACGTPVALADVPVFREHVEAGAAVAFDARDPLDTARGILEAHRDAARLRRAGYAVAEHSSVEGTARRLAEVYHRILKNATVALPARR